MSVKFKIILFLSVVIMASETAKILVVVPTPSISHQVPFRPLTQELAKRGHDVTILTTDPAFPKGQAPENLTEIDLHDMSYTLWRDLELTNEMSSAKQFDNVKHMRKIYHLTSLIFERQLESQEVKAIMSNETQYDLLIIEAWVKPAFLFAHIFKNVPVILYSSFHGISYNYDNVGAPGRPVLLYPTLMRTKLSNLTVWEKISELYIHYGFESMFSDQEIVDNQLVKKILGPDAPSIKELEKSVDMLFLNVYPIVDFNRPVPPNVVYIGGIHQKPAKELPKELKQYLDSSKNGVIYISFGSIINPSHLPPEMIHELIKAFSRLPYDVLWKWDKDELPEKTTNIRISKWLPQADLLKHPNIKLFITHGGFQSTDEAITAGVPLIGMPMRGDQWYNVELYVMHKVGIRVDMVSVTADNFVEAINTVINDKSYRKNMARLRSLMHDQPQSALERAVWWTEHLLRHGGGRHLRAPAANMTWAEYLDVELLAVLAFLCAIIVGGFCFVLHVLVSLVSNYPETNRKLKKC